MRVVLNSWAASEGFYLFFLLHFKTSVIINEAPSGAVGWGTALQAGRSRVRIPLVTLELFIDIIRTMALGSTHPLTEMSTRNISWGGGYRRPVRMVDNLTTSMCWLSWNLGASTSWNPQGLSRPVMGLLYFYHYDWPLRPVSVTCCTSKATVCKSMISVFYFLFVSCLLFFLHFFCHRYVTSQYSLRYQGQQEVKNNTDIWRDM